MHACMYGNEESILHYGQSMLLHWRPIGVSKFLKQNSFIFSLSITTFNTVHRFEDSYT